MLYTYTRLSIIILWLDLQKGNFSMQLIYQ